MNRQSQFTTPIPIVCLDPILHTEDNPFCGDETCPCMEELYDLVEAEIERAKQEEINTYFRCAAHPNTTVSVKGNAYFCVRCGCAPEKMVVE